MAELTGEPDWPRDLHALLTAATAHGVHVLCRCGTWEGWWHSEHTRAWVLDDHAHHRRAASNGGNTPPVQ